MSPSDTSTTKSSKGFKKTLASIFKSPAAEARSRVLVETVNQAEQDNFSIYSDPKPGNEFDKDKAKRLVAQRDASSPSGSFVLGVYKPAMASQGYAGYYSAKGR
ncbi:hypothetical protein GE09DRAFT_1061226 [Coniochaeta sp. 2T2.1]|nr:hypothetical protein GE09DRAFT_1061226 [Coniochaeta sp. 2T2.1]